MVDKPACISFSKEIFDRLWNKLEDYAFSGATEITTVTTEQLDYTLSVNGHIDDPELVQYTSFEGNDPCLKFAINNRWVNGYGEHSAYPHMNFCYNGNVYQLETLGKEMAFLYKFKSKNEYAPIELQDSSDYYNQIAYTFDEGIVYTNPGATDDEIAKAFTYALYTLLGIQPDQEYCDGNRAQVESGFIFWPNTMIEPESRTE